MGRLLVVEDDETIGSLLRAGLESHGHAVTWARGGRSALREATLTEFDLVLLDLGLPDLDGVEVCRDNNVRPRVLARTGADHIAGIVDADVLKSEILE